MTFRGSLLVLGALVGTAWSEMKADVSLHTVCSSSAFEVLTINRATSTIIEKAELQSRPDEGSKNNNNIYTYIVAVIHICRTSLATMVPVLHASLPICGAGHPTGVLALYF